MLKSCQLKKPWDYISWFILNLFFISPACSSLYKTLLLPDLKYPNCYCTIFRNSSNVSKITFPLFLCICIVYTHKPWYCALRLPINSAVALSLKYNRVIVNVICNTCCLPSFGAQISAVKKSFSFIKLRPDVIRKKWLTFVACTILNRAGVQD